MKALILAAGVGKRLGTFTAQHPKCMLEIGNRSLIQRTLGALAACGLDETTIVVGYRADQIRAHAGSDVGGMAISYKTNADFREGSILSLQAGAGLLGSGDLLLMDADVLFPGELLQALIEAPSPACVLLDGRVAGSGEEMILCASQGRVWDLTRRQAGQRLTPPAGVDEYDAIGESVGFFKLDSGSGSILRELIEARIADGDRHVEYEATFADLFARYPFGYQRVDDFPWTEVDFPEDAERARDDILPKIEAMRAADR